MSLTCKPRDAIGVSRTFITHTYQGSLHKDSTAGIRAACAVKGIQNQAYAAHDMSGGFPAVCKAGQLEHRLPCTLSLQSHERTGQGEAKKCGTYNSLCAAVCNVKHLHHVRLQQHSTADNCKHLQIPAIYLQLESNCILTPVIIAC